ncbi:MAG: hypothetical protein HXY23_04480 [Parvularculaceae bacterium]|nr:hypothetical protein [Parvularculaceae bacterium]
MAVAFRNLLVSGAFAGALVAAAPAHAGQKIIDQTIDICSVETFYGPIGTNGATEVDIGIFNADTGVNNFGTTCDALTDPTTTFSPFSINFFGQTYDKIFVNENGILSFGAPVTQDPSTSLFALNVPAIAPFFSNGVLPSPGVLEFGWGGLDQFWLTWFGLEEEGSATGDRNSFQIAIINKGGGDFDLLFNYDFIEWDPGQAGFTDGAGNGYLFPGSGDAGALLGDESPFGAFPCTANSLACNFFNLGPFATDLNGDPRVGLYRFEFRNGAPLATPGPVVPLPAAFWLFLAGPALLGAGRLLKKRA